MRTLMRRLVSYFCGCRSCGHTAHANEFGAAGGKCPECGSTDFWEQI